MRIGKFPSAAGLGVSRRTALAALAAVTGSACTQIEFLAANVPAMFGHYRRQTNISFGPDRRQCLDLYIPESPAGPRSVVVFWHGGRWSDGDKGQYRFVGAALTELGCVAVLPNHRLYPTVRMPEFMHDAALAGAWAANYAREAGASAHLFLMGHSSGAHVATLVALDPRYFAAIGAKPPVSGVIGLSGPYDFLPLLDADLQEMFGPPDLYPLSQPINFVSSGSPPMLLIDGERDESVAPKNTRNLAAALQSAGVAVTLRMYPRLGHADTIAALSEPARRRAPIIADIGTFIGQFS